MVHVSQRKYQYNKKLHERKKQRHNKVHEGKLEVQVSRGKS